MFVYINHLSVWLSLLYDRKIFKHSNKAVCHFFVLNSSICYVLLYGLVPFRKGDFHGVKFPRMIFKSGSLGGA